jgi:pimeloyl-ACP methyl ester carboxylesterase
MCRPVHRTGVPTATADDGTGLRYAVAGEGADPPVALVNDAGLGAWAWGWQHEPLAGSRRVVTYDHRGTGESDAAAEGPFDVDTLAADLGTVLAAADTKPAHLVGFGLGGAVALRYARENGVRSLTLVGTAAGDAVDEAGLDRCYPDGADEEAVRATLPALFSDAFRDADPSLLERIVDWRRAEDAPPRARRAQTDAWLAFDPGLLYEVTTPAVVLRGTDDPAVDRATAEALADDLPRGRFEPVAGRRLAHIESSRPVNDALLDFFAEVDDDD